ncbi:phosphoethanolamine--lipid A transferase [Campylobacter novaezeelandiae]|uniref:phosphoethanolamine transferase n=1 Tax=Campylobacter novaezeelandiae TaxID=2267891 RepID=UPI0010381986|nr:phosphoethanolamine--lipid A transferase [Campylobacter novaezeelandiae]TBR79749.1 phosphoethanolamine--lipid A transferase [Campylobacter novaezeelandiae]
MLKISWFKFVLLNSLLITCLNFNLFIFVYEKIQNTWLTLAFIVMYFLLIHTIFSLLFIKFLTKIFSIFFILSSLISIYFIHYYGVLIDSDMILNAMQTDIKEVKELLNWRLILLTLGSLILIIFIIKLKIVNSKILPTKIMSIFLALILFLCIFLPLTKTYIPFFRNYNEIRMYNTPFYQIYSLWRYYSKNIKAKEKFKIIENDAYIEDNTSKKLLILVVGETARAANYSLGGYTINDTNAYTKKEKVIFFNDVSSCGTATAISLPCMFSISKREDFSINEFQENALDILQKLGINTIWIDNNSGGCKGVCDRIKQTELYSYQYDGNLLDSLKEKLENLKNQNIIVLHLQGSHGPTYYKRYPKEFKKFLPTCDTNTLDKCSQEALINTYDNTLLYTDFILSEIITLLKEKSDYQSSLIYISDHGESLGENGLYLHGMPYAFAPKYQTHIPLIFWSNDSNLIKLAEKYKNLKLSQDNLFSSLLGYFNVKSNVYQSNYDLFNNSLKANP